MSKSLSTTVQQQLAARQQAMAERLSGLSGGTSKPFVKAKAKRFTFPDESFVKNELPIVILDWTYSNSYWDGEYVQGQSVSPVCSAVGPVAGEMAPPPNAPQRQADKCALCPQNQFGSGKGNGKACKNTVTIAFLRWDDEVDDDTIYYLSVPPASLKKFGAYTRKLAEGGAAEVQVVTVVSFNDSVDYVNFDFRADRDMTAEYIAQDEDGSSYLDSYVEFMGDATEALNQPPTFGQDDDEE
jgi:hypothetical protein